MAEDTSEDHHYCDGEEDPVAEESLVSLAPLVCGSLVRTIKQDPYGSAVQPGWP
jgi:hypothetical protein